MNRKRDLGVLGYAYSSDPSRRQALGTIKRFTSAANSNLAVFCLSISGVAAGSTAQITMLTGELFPLDLVPQPFRDIVLALPFANAVFLPVGYLTGRVELAQVGHGVGKRWRPSLSADL